MKKKRQAQPNSSLLEKMSCETKTPGTGQKVIIWLPRVLAVIFIGFISLFALDTPIFSLGFIIHLIPSFILILITWLAWHRPRLGGAIFIFLFFVFTGFFHTYRNVINFVLISLPILIIGLCLLAQGRTTEAG